MKTIWDAATMDPPQDDSPAEYKKDYDERIRDLTWYLENWLPNIVDYDNYPDTVRYQWRITSKRPIEGKQRVRVTITREAFGLIVFENLRTRWINNFIFDDENKGKLINGKKPKCPKYNKNKPETHKYKSEWSDFKEGQNSKWNPVATSEFNLRKDTITKWRANDEANGYKAQDFAMKLIKESRGIQEVPTVTPAANKRRRNNNGNGGPQPPTVAECSNIIDE